MQKLLVWATPCTWNFGSKW